MTLRTQKCVISPYKSPSTEYRADCTFCSYIIPTKTQWANVRLDLIDCVVESNASIGFDSSCGHDLVSDWVRAEARNAIKHNIFSSQNKNI